MLGPLLAMSHDLAWARTESDLCAAVARAVEALYPGAAHAVRLVDPRSLALTAFRAKGRLRAQGRERLALHRATLEAEGLPVAALEAGRGEGHRRGRAALRGERHRGGGAAGGGRGAPRRDQRGVPRRRGGGRPAAAPAARQRGRARGAQPAGPRRARLAQDLPRVAHRARQRAHHGGQPGPGGHGLERRPGPPHRPRARRGAGAPARAAGRLRPGRAGGGAGPHPGRRGGGRRSRPRWRWPAAGRPGWP